MEGGDVIESTRPEIGPSAGCTSTVDVARHCIRGTGPLLPGLQLLTQGAPMIDGAGRRVAAWCEARAGTRVEGLMRKATGRSGADVCTALAREACMSAAVVMCNCRRVGNGQRSLQVCTRHAFSPRRTQLRPYNTPPRRLLVAPKRDTKGFIVALSTLAPCMTYISPARFTYFVGMPMNGNYALLTSSQYDCWHRSWLSSLLGLFCTQFPTASLAVCRYYFALRTASTSQPALALSASMLPCCTHSSSPRP